MMVMKNHCGRGRSPSMFFLCFRPPSTGEAAVVDSPIKFRPQSTDEAAVVDSPVKLVLSFSEDENGRRRKKKDRRSLAGVFKAMFFQTSLTKKSGSESSRQNSYRSSSNLSSKNEKVKNSMKKVESLKELSDPEERNSSRSSVFSSTSSIVTSSSSSSCTSISQKKRSSSLDLQQSNTNKKSKKRDVDNSWNNNPTIGMCTIVCCLVALILWGKVVAILACTTIWVFFVPRRVTLPVNDVDSEVDSEEHKKRVIMEGLLERNNRPRLV